MKFSARIAIMAMVASMLLVNPALSEVQQVTPEQRAAAQAAARARLQAAKRQADAAVLNEARLEAWLVSDEFADRCAEALRRFGMVHTACERALIVRSLEFTVMPEDWQP